MNEDSFNLAEIWQFPGGRTSFGGQLGLVRLGDLSSGGGPSDEQFISRKRKTTDSELIKRLANNCVDDGHELNDGNVGDGKRMHAVGRKIGDDACNGKGRTAEKPSPGKNGERKAPESVEPPKQDYIHVRARRGQATDSHSLAERARREKISERMKILQDLVPGCNKVIGKALVLDEIINYIQSLQRQVEFLSMKLEAVNARFPPGIEAFSVKDIGQHGVGHTSMPFGSQAGRGPSPEWLHMQ